MDTTAIVERLERLEELLAALRRDHAAIVAASESSNADDEHDPEGSTIAWEREQMSALIARHEAEREQLTAALGRAAAGTYGVCERCGRPIPAERLAVRPAARTCVGCA
ncbi:MULTISPECIES: TraR/DksA C4-type zinc finger protein [unclassified Mumia]|uniref:TraR/DksA family transcriptional regulator n=1 Tax=unclassified Mumia TaxID=2621872 RepID=UPI00261DEE69|nr:MULTISPECIES: TraR/DksA C4-type zinc finger protein [unclassified Mumia]MDD9349819.1 TraR/DksA C4-type zinc finger protein [Mumia sp.]